MVGCRSKKCVCTTFFWVYLNIDLTEAEWEYAAAADVGQREYNLQRAKNTLGLVYTRSGKDKLKEIS
jgi:hypothetical protein